jgi:5'(3')-deoxyribonucleotidase
MRFHDIINEKSEGKPIVYIDMDGVLANFFEEWAKMAGIKSGNYKDIPPADIDPTLDKMIGTDFFAQLPKFPSADKLIQMVINLFGSYKILSSPLRNDHENSKKHKIDWIGRKLKIKPSETIISSNKGAFATQPDGTPNILIDDLGKNIQNWMNNGGLGIKYQADEDPLSKVHQWLEQFKKGEATQEDINEADDFRRGKLR